jgi:hypothetical protein
MFFYFLKLLNDLLFKKLVLKFILFKLYALSLSILIYFRFTLLLFWRLGIYLSIKLFRLCSFLFFIIIYNNLIIFIWSLLGLSFIYFNISNLRYNLNLFICNVIFLIICFWQFTLWTDSFFNIRYFIIILSWIIFAN